MKALILSVTLMLSFQAFATQLVPEARCKGEENGRAITLTSYVNPQKWCSSPRQRNSIVVIESGDDLGSAYSCLSTDRGNVTRHTNNERANPMQFEFDQTQSPEVGELKRNSVTTKLSCVFVQYELDCANP